MREAKEIIARNLEDVRRRMADAAARRGRDPSAVTLVAVTKTVGANEVRALHALGQQEIGENRVQPALAKMEAVSDLPLRWHMIGHLQRNKVKKAVMIFDMIETVDSIAIAREIDKSCAQIGKVMPVLIEINSGREKQKTGVLPEEVEQFIKEISSLPNIRIKGLMTMGPRFGNPEDAKPYFVETRRLFDKFKEMELPNVEMQYLSMGMSNSYQVALEEGANMVRLGSKLFGERSYK